MRSLGLVTAFGLALGGPVLAGECSSLVKSVCPGAEADAPSTRRVLKVQVQPPAFAKGDRFPVEERSLLMNPTRHRLPKVDGPWRYYAMEGVVYKVDNSTAIVTEVINDNRTWRLH